MDLILFLLLISATSGFIFRKLRQEQETSWVITYYNKDGSTTGEEYVCGHLTKRDVHEWVLTSTGKVFWNFTIEKL